MFTNESYKEFLELMADAKATYKQAGARCRIGPRRNGNISTYQIPLPAAFLGLWVGLALLKKVFVFSAHWLSMIYTDKVRNIKDQWRSKARGSHVS
ncbi:hypothetical protein ElyMa_001339200 [Elysia marginata]|uniref:Uncharacterized protein n=1 Tax=Elysia marginata TaxID=1093978 RepID=A0AAV4IMP3_9GAST|nr:hypothetical protein ElyMa_001339200 [Elysia marginata]